MKFVKMVGNICFAWVLLYLLGAFLYAEWDISFWSDWARGCLVILALYFAMGAYGTRNLED